MWLKAGPDQPESRYSEYLELDLSTVVPSIAGPKRPQDRIALTDAKDAFRKVLPTYVAHDEGDSGDAESFPASDPPAIDDGGDKPADGPDQRPPVEQGRRSPTPRGASSRSTTASSRSPRSRAAPTPRTRR